MYMHMYTQYNTQTCSDTHVRILTCTGTGLDHCKAVIAVITRKYVDSKFCTSELYTANSDRKNIFPVIFEDVDYSASEHARGVKYVIGSINWTMFRPGYDDYHLSLERLVRGMKDQGLGKWRGREKGRGGGRAGERGGGGGCGVVRSPDSRQ